ncbi:hypothetical protein JIN82_02475 [Persicirhabdus sediminis]|uniref:Addiction module component n=2 Tax=Persicirhabdus sediminis TaxID=454144 RepID=A0A8J7SHU4_9BACT|nr:hypothetical protein [Persicirhabdus sediminis]
MLDIILQKIESLSAAEQDQLAARLLVLRMKRSNAGGSAIEKVHKRIDDGEPTKWTDWEVAQKALDKPDA